MIFPRHEPEPAAALDAGVQADGGRDGGRDAGKLGAPVPPAPPGKVLVLPPKKKVP
jgi:hypothetical protein